MKQKRLSETVEPYFSPAEVSRRQCLRSLRYGKGWMVAWSRPAAEFDVAAALRVEGLDAFVPAIRTPRIVCPFARNRGHGKTRYTTILLPAFPRYLLFRATENEPSWQRVLRVDGVTAVVREPGGKRDPGHLSDDVAHLLRGPQQDGVIEDLTTMLGELVRYAAGDKVRVSTGPFAQASGVVIEHHGRSVRVLLSVFNRRSEALVETSNLDKVL